MDFFRMSLDLCIDPFECEFPGLISEILSLPPETPERAPILAASITKNGFAYMICNKLLYIWSYVGKERAPHAYKLHLPGTGLPYTLNLVQLFHVDNNHLPSIIVVSPEGLLRYWPVIGTQYKEKEINLYNEVVQSILLFNDEEHVNRFILSTTSGSFYMIDIFKEKFANAQEDCILFKQIQLSSPSFTKRVSAVLFGAQMQKQE